MNAQTHKMSTVIAVSTLCLLGSAMLQAQYSSPQGITTDPGGNLWLAEAAANTVLEISPANGATLGKIQAGLDNPVRLAFDSNANLYVANLVSNDVTVYSSTGTLTKTVSGINRPLGVAVDAADNLFVASNSGSEVYVFNAAGQEIQVLNHDTSGHYFDAPGALALYGRNLYVAFNDGSVISYNSGNFASGSAIEVTTYVHSGSGGPTGIAFDSAGNVYVSYYYTNNVVEYSPSGKVLLNITSDVFQPEGIAVDSAGTIYVANTEASKNTVSVFNGSTLLRQLQGGRVVNFDQDTKGKAIPSGTVVNQTYASWGVTFASESTSAGNAYAAACSPGYGPPASPPNAISIWSNQCFFNLEAFDLNNAKPGAIQATFSPHVTTVSIQVLPFCTGSGQDNACLPPQGDPYLSAFNSSGELIASMNAPGGLGVQQTMTVNAPAGETIWFVQFSVPWVGSSGGSNPSTGFSNVGVFDNLTFE